MKNSNVRQSIFEEVQAAYNLPSLKLIKASVTRWLSHGKAVQRVLDRFEPLLAALEAIYERKKEPMVRGIWDSLVNPEMIVVMCFLADVLNATNSLQTFLQAERLNFLNLPTQVDKLKLTLRNKMENMNHPATCYYNKLQGFLDIDATTAERRYDSRSNSNVFDVERFYDNTARPFLEKLTNEINLAFVIPDHLKGFTALEPLMVPVDGSELPDYGVSLIQSLAELYGKSSNSLIDTIVGPPLNGEALIQ